ncbi:hypothetical protein ACFV16_31970 [Streptomyces massasporeus]|uniref:hypothetical protein n=1 Tax=Streptomyces massasporeus TaxID=67324 RepID=UPI0036891316
MKFPIEIKVNIDGNIADALSALDQTQGEQAQKRLIWFAEHRQGVADGRLLLDSGVIVRFRSGDTPDELTVKLRPCTTEQLSSRFSEPFDKESFEYKVEEDWSGIRRALSASATRTHPQGALLHAVTPGADAAAPLDTLQLQFLQECAPGVHINGLDALGPISSTKLNNVPIDDLEVDLERWTVVDLDFLELSIRIKPKHGEDFHEFEQRAERKQKKLESAVQDRGVVISENPENKTRRVLTALARNHH